MNYELRITNYELWIMNYELRITNYELRIMNYELRITNYELRIMNYELRITNYELWIMNYELRIMSKSHVQHMSERSFQKPRNTLPAKKLLSAFEKQTSGGRLSEWTATAGL